MHFGEQFDLDEADRDIMREVFELKESARERKTKQSENLKFASIANKTNESQQMEWHKLKQPQFQTLDQYFQILDE